MFIQKYFQFKNSIIFITLLKLSDFIRITNLLSINSKKPTTHIV